MKKFAFFFAIILTTAFTMPVSAQNGSLMGRSTLTSPSGRTIKAPEASFTQQPAPRQKVYNVEDTVRVHINQNWAYQNTARNQRKKSIEAEARVTYWSSFAGFWKLPKKADVAALPEIGGEIDHKTQNQGDMTRREKLDFKITCRVVSVQDNGNLHIEGTSSQQIGEEGKVMYVGGIIRPEDIRADNTIEGDRVADLTVKEIPSGNVYDTVRRPWGTRLLEHVKPF